MTKHQEILRAFSESGEELVLALPAIGYVAGRIDSVVDDVVTVAMSDEQKVVLHHSQVAVLRK